VLRALGRVPALKPVLPDHGLPFQLVHHDDVAVALVAGVLGRGEPGIYNLAGAGEVRLSDIAKELGWHSVPIPKRAVDVTARIAGRIPLLAVEAGWLERYASRCSWTAPVLVNSWGGNRHTTVLKRSTN
jgi:UDP-glucose 4-epimerase